MKDFILENLKQYPAFRERATKNKWLGGLILKKYGVELTPKMKDMLQDIVTDIQNGDRYWRLHTEENPELRGSDWSTGQAMEAQTLDKLGYKPSLWKEEETLAEFMSRP